MLRLEPPELENTYRSAVESAALLRRSGESAKANRLESLARILARELERRERRRQTDPRLSHPGF
jgi:hypothetical protein